MEVPFNFKGDRRGGEGMGSISILISDINVVLYIPIYRRYTVLYTFYCTAMPALFARRRMDDGEQSGHRGAERMRFCSSR